jgi:hypothetical protein
MAEDTESRIIFEFPFALYRAGTGNGKSIK